MKPQATLSMNPLQDELGSDASNGEAILEKAIKKPDAGLIAPGKLQGVALRSAPSKRGSRDMETRKPDALRTEKKRPEFSVSTLGTTREAAAGRTLRSDAELAKILELECGFTETAPQ